MAEGEAPREGRRDKGQKSSREAGKRKGEEKKKASTPLTSSAENTQKAPKPRQSDRTLAKRQKP